MRASAKSGAMIETLVAKRDARKDGFVSVIRKAMETKLGDDAEEAVQGTLQERNPPQRGKGSRYHRPGEGPLHRLVRGRCPDAAVARKPVRGRSHRGRREGGPTPLPCCLKEIRKWHRQLVRSPGTRRRLTPRPRPSAARSHPQPAANGHAEKRPPVFTWSHPTGSGRIEIAVWDKVVQTDNGERVLYYVTCQRSYRQAGRRIREHGHLLAHGLLVLAHGLEVAFDRIKEMQRANRSNISWSSTGPLLETGGGFSTAIPSRALPVRGLPHLHPIA